MTSAAPEEETDDPQTLRAMIHDLNNYLVSILNNAEFLTEDLDPATPQHGFAKRIHAATEKAVSLSAKISAEARRSENR